MQPKSDADLKAGLEFLGLQLLYLPSNTPDKEGKTDMVGYMPGWLFVRHGKYWVPVPEKSKRVSGPLRQSPLR